jgi:hypothetical protein
MAIYLSLGLHQGRTRYRRSLQPSEKNISTLKHQNYLLFLYLWVIFTLLDLDPEVSAIRKWVHSELQSTVPNRMEKILPNVRYTQENTKEVDSVSAKPMILWFPRPCGFFLSSSSSTVVPVLSSPSPSCRSTSGYGSSPPFLTYNPHYFYPRVLINI